jgi:hypothetical protein
VFTGPRGRARRAGYGRHRGARNPDAAQQRGLARPRAAKQHEDFAGFHVEVEPGQRRDAAVAFDQALDPQQRQRAQRGIEPGAMRQLGAVERLQGAGADQPGKRPLAGRHHHVVAGMPRQQLALQRLASRTRPIPLIRVSSAGVHFRLTVKPV